MVTLKHVGKSNMAAGKPEVLITQKLFDVSEKFQRRQPGIQRCGPIGTIPSIVRHRPAPEIEMAVL